ncbi:dihydroorotate dehydrogenase electron transfer subunit [Petroclostridium sp. X23]|uniref:dihydroorotate dehydrogenase electron transfer subunit n=1 Tax=Petroclostridium sp. X23 TaxID=3045146 RepID=UPI0024ADAE85|nr:dihydroorotate dehydrogenase electron transfer subunit [Petroclostridium sp. X23]WHH59535.1 dihydroorotate dehydrogenase electron transfer subunit [Petroclostridium sp. X23]
MYKQTYLCLITYKKEIAPGIIDMRIKSEEIAQQAQPGQFLNIKCCNGLNAILRRPISICDVDVEKHEVRFIFQIKGEGTKLLSSKSIGEQLDILGPLGTAFALEQQYSNPLLIGGGIGTFPLLYLAKKLDRENISAYLGFRNKDIVTLEDEFKNYCSDVQIATDDGSYGFNGYVTQLLEKKIQEGKVDIVYACGPEPMLKAVVDMCKANNLYTQISMEQRMGCGIGACLVCVCKIKVNTEDGWDYKHVCKDGPVFCGNEVIFSE